MLAVGAERHALCHGFPLFGQNAATPTYSGILSLFPLPIPWPRASTSRPAFLLRSPVWTPTVVPEVPSIYATCTGKRGAAWNRFHFLTSTNALFGEFSR